MLNLLIYGSLYGVFSHTFGQSDIIAPVQAQTPLPTPNTQYADNEIIVHFAPTYAPHNLEPHVQQRDLLGNSFPGKIQLFFTNLALTLQEKPLPEDTLARMHIIEEQAGTIEKTPMFDIKGQSQENTYRIMLNGTVDVPEAVELFESLQEVQYAQPNYLYETYTHL